MQHIRHQGVLPACMDLRMALLTGVGAGIGGGGEIGAQGVITDTAAGQHRQEEDPWQ